MHTGNVCVRMWVCVYMYTHMYVYICIYIIYRIYMYIFLNLYTIYIRVSLLQNYPNILSQQLKLWRKTSIHRNTDNKTQILKNENKIK